MRSLLDFKQPKPDVIRGIPVLILSGERDQMPLEVARRDAQGAEAARDAARSMFDVPPDQRPDAVFVANDHMAFSVMDVIRFELGLSIPGDVSQMNDCKARSQ